MVVTSRNQQRLVNPDHPRMLQNLFELQTREKPELVFSQINYTLRRLKQEPRSPELDALILRFEPRVEVYNIGYTAYFQSLERYERRSEALSDKLKEQTEHLKTWIGVIENRLKGQPQVIRVLYPRGLEVFSSVDDRDRLSGHQIFVSRLAEFPELSSLRTEASGFLEELREVYQEFIRAEKSISEFSSALEVLRINVTQGMYYLLNYLISSYGDHNQKIESWFDFEELYSRRPVRTTQMVPEKVLR